MYYGSLQDFLFAKFRNYQLAEDVTNESFLRLMQVKSPQEIVNPRAYLFRTATNLAIDQIRRLNLGIVTNNNTVDYESVQSHEPGPEALYQYGEIQGLLASTIKQLPAKHRKIFYLYRVEGLTTAEIANVFSVSQRMVQKYLAQTLQHLHENLQPVLGNEESDGKDR